MKNDVVVTGHRIVLAGFWKRVAATLIDTIILFVLIFICGFIYGLMFVTQETNLAELRGYTNGFSFLFTAIYFIGYHASSYQATPGKIAVGIKVVRYDGSGLLIGGAFLRFLATILNGFTFGIGWLLAMLTRDKQALHDFLCKTLVVDKWAFTFHANRQKRGLGAVTIVTLLTLIPIFIFVLALTSHPQYR